MLCTYLQTGCKLICSETNLQHEALWHSRESFYLKYFRLVVKNKSQPACLSFMFAVIVPKPPVSYFGCRAVELASWTEFPLPDTCSAQKKKCCPSILKILLQGLKFKDRPSNADNGWWEEESVALAFGIMSDPHTTSISAMRIMIPHTLRRCASVLLYVTTFLTVWLKGH